MTAASAWRDGFGRRIRQAMLLGLRLGNAAAKFALAVYMARHLGLEEVGVYGLLVGAAATIPGIFGFGLNDWTSRHVVGMGREEAVAVATTRLTLTLVVDLVLLCVAAALFVAVGPAMATTTALAIGAILLLEHLAVDDYALEIGRERPTFANLQLFLRAGAWPPVVIVWGLIDPAARSLDVVLGGWLVGLVAMWAVVAARSLGGGRWRLMRIDRGFLRRALRGALPFWLADFGAVGNLYLDRFVVSAFLGMELTGVYTFFWSFTNVVHTLAVNGVIQPQIPRLVAAARLPDPAPFALERRRLTRDSRMWTALLALGVGAFLPMLLPWLGRPLLEANLPIFAVVLLATVVRIVSDGFGMMLYALHRDRTIAATALVGVAGTGLLGPLLIGLFGLPGAASTYLVVALGLVLARRTILQREVARRTKAFEARAR